jgi:ubiquinone/menaquinone biosynthesis C-methylase UbiE
MAQDHFSGHSADYAKFRPGYPEALFDWIAAQTASRDLAWDCGCGNGQASQPLAQRFARVVGTDVSAQQIAQAAPHPRIEYRVAPAEQSDLADTSVDVVTIAQALHWFDFERFYAEVQRVLKPDGIIVAWTYQLLRADSAVDALLTDFYSRVLGPWWPPERKWVDAGYRGMPFPFTAIETPGFEIKLQWTLADLLAYLGTWSATQRYRQAEGADPLPALGELLAPVWPDGTREIVWPIAMLAGHV